MEACQRDNQLCALVTVTAPEQLKPRDAVAEGCMHGPTERHHTDTRAPLLRELQIGKQAALGHERSC